MYFVAEHATDQSLRSRQAVHQMVKRQKWFDLNKAIYDGTKSVTCRLRSVPAQMTLFLHTVLRASLFVGRPP